MKAETEGGTQGVDHLKEGEIGIEEIEAEVEVVTVTGAEEDPDLDHEVDPVLTLQVIGEETKKEGVVSEEMEIEIVPQEIEGVIDLAVEIVVTETAETTEEVVATDSETTRIKMVVNRTKNHEKSTLKDLKAMRMTIIVKMKKNNRKATTQKKKNKPK